MIDWHTQWAIHGHNFSNGFVHIPCAEKEIILEPGPGFGDFSHPTTRLVLDMMQPYVAGKTVFDIGCGSGVLAIGACLLGAKAAHGIDIDPEAILHAKKNVKLNGLETICTFSKRPKTCDIIVMNMIRTEQQLAYKSYKCLYSCTSGILKEDRDRYLALTKSWGWILLEEKEEAGWLGFAFKTKTT